MQGMSESMGKLFISHRVGRNHIKRPAQIVIQQPENTVDHIVDMDPRQILTAIADRPAETQLKDRQHLPQNPAFRCQHYAGAQQANAGAIALRAAGNLFPAGAQFVGELIMWRLFFGDNDFAEITVLTRRRS